MSVAASLPLRTSAHRAWLPLVAVVAAVVAWRIVAMGVAAERDGGAALIGIGPPPAAPAGSPEAAWRTQVARNPADFVALAMLAREFERQGRGDDARAAMAEAVRLAPADRQVLLEAGAFRLRAGDDAQALELLRRAADLHPDVREPLFPLFTAALGDARHDAWFARVAAADPEWWPQFAAYACRQAADSGALQRAVAARVAAGVQRDDELRCVIDRLRRERRWDQAYQVWLNGLPLAQRQRVGYVYNGRFERPPSGVGFDWIVPAQERVAVQVLPAEGASGERALKVEFADKRWEGPPLLQYLVLAPGRYAFEARARADGLQSWLGVQVGLYCERGDDRVGAQLYRSERLAGTTGWSALRGEFTVATDCPAQVLRIELANPRRDADTPGDAVARLRGAVWLDDVRVRRLD